MRSAKAHPSATRQTIKYALGVAALAAAYFITAKLGLLLDAVSGFATLVWPPTGIAIATLLLFGENYWPGIAIGAFLVNFQTGAPPFVAAGIALGNTLEAVLAVRILKRLKFDPAFSRLRDALSFITFAAFVCTAVSATIGVTSLWLGGILAHGAYPETWLAWWTGDALGTLVVAPLIIGWVVSRPSRVSVRKFLEGAALTFLLVFICYIVFIGPLSVPPGTWPLTYFLFLPLLWATLSFGPVGTATLTFVLAAIAIWSTTVGHGPFVRGSLSQNLFLLQIFIGVIAIAKTIVASVVMERKRALARVQELNAGLEKLVDKRTVELTKTNERLLLSQAMLERRRLILREVINMIDEGVVAVTKNGMQVVVNPAAESIIGKASGKSTVGSEKDEKTPKKSRQNELRAVPSGELLLTRALDGNETTTTLVLKKPGASEGVEVNVSAKPVKDEAGEIIAGIAVFTPVEKEDT